MEQPQQPQQPRGIKVGTQNILDAYKETVDELTNEKVGMKAYIKHLEGRIAELEKPAEENAEG